MVRRLLGGLLAAALILPPLLLAAHVTSDRPGGLHVSGDGAPGLRAALGPATRLTETPETARMEVVLLRRWDNMAGLGQLATLCRDACDGTHDAVLIRQPSRQGMRQILFLDVGAMGAGDALDGGGGLPPRTRDCLAQPLDWFMRDDVALDTMCGRGIARVWRLPPGP